MTSLDARPRSEERAADRAVSTLPMSVRLRAAAPLFVGAALVYFLLKPVGSLPVKGWVPILIGLSYVASALLSGRRGLLLGPGLVIGFWGIAPMTTNYRPEFPGMFYLTLGTGLLVAAILAERGFYRITPMSLALPVLFMGGIMFTSSKVGSSLTLVLATLLVVWGLAELRPQKVSQQPAVVTATPGRAA